MSTSPGSNSSGSPAPGRPHQSKRDRANTPHVAHENRLDVEQLESRQMLSSVVLTNAQLVDTAVDYLRTHAADYGLVPQDLNEFVVTDQYTTKGLDISHIYLRQRHNGLEVRNANINVNVRLDGEVVSAGNRFVSGIWDDQYSVVPKLSAEDALARVVSQYGWTSEKSPIVISSSTDVQRSGQMTPGDIAIQNINFKLDFVPVEGELELAWTFEIRRPLGEAWYNSSFSATDGSLLLESNWIDHAVYNVLDRPIDSPLFGSQSLVVDPNDRIVSPFGWHDLDGIPGIDRFDTSGNNVFAQIDRFATDAGNGYRAQGGVNLEFYGTYNFGANPVSSADAVTTNLFYWNNLLHDIHYQYGFDEAAGNFQFNNYGNGGLGNDAVRADAQYGARLGMRNNAFFATPPDGQNPQMAMLEWTFTIPRRDSSFENSIIVHEFGHGVSNRLTGGPSNADALEDVQSLAMGEGWSDFYALMINQTTSDRANDAYPLGNWVLGDDLILTPGIRRVFYSFNLNINPHTFAAYNLSQESHDAGEIWASVLWDLNWYLINGRQGQPGSPGFAGHGFDSDIYNGDGGNNIALQLVMDGMKLQPSNPSFLEARNAILLADQLRYGGENQRAIWAAFARRGMGINATDGGSRSRVVVEDFEEPTQSNGQLEFNRDTYTIGGQAGNVVVNLFETDLVNTGSIDVQIESNGGDIETVTLFEVSPANFRGSIDLARAPIFFNDGTLHVRGGDTITVTYFDDDVGNGQPGEVTDTATIAGGDTFVGSVTYTSAAAVAIPGNSTVTSTIAVPDVFSVADININVNITQPNTSSLRLTLIGPNDQRVLLAGNVGNGQNFIGTNFDDDNDAMGNPWPAIATGAAPFTGTFRPQELLSLFDGIPANGNWKLEVVNNANAGGTINSWSITIFNANFAPRRFDFGWPLPIQPVARGFTAVSTADYNPTDGYGWQADIGKLRPLMRLDGSALSQDFVFAAKKTFLVDVPNGVYDVTLYVGDTLIARDDMGLYLEGVLRDSVDTAPGEIATRTFRVAVNDGRLTVAIKDLGGLDPFVALVGLEVEEVNRQQFDFGAVGSPVANGYTAVNATAYSAQLGYGWQNDTVGLTAVDRGIGSSLNRDLNLLESGTFSVKVPVGSYRVSVTYGDPSFDRDLMGVFLEGTYRGFVSTVAGQTRRVNYTADVIDGELTIFFQDLGGSDEYVAIVALEVSPSSGGGGGGPIWAGGTTVEGLQSDVSNGNAIGQTELDRLGALPQMPGTSARSRQEPSNLSTGLDFSFYAPPAIQSGEKSNENLAVGGKVSLRV